MKKYIQIIPIEFNGSLGLLPKEDYMLVPIEVMSEKRYECVAVSVPAISKGIFIKENHDKLNAKFKIITFNSWLSYLKFLYNQKNATIFANDRVAKSFVSCFFGRYTIFMSHQSRLPLKWWQREIFKFFVKRFDAIKVSNPFEKKELVKIGVKPEKIHYIPLSIDHDFFGKKISEKIKEETRAKYKIRDDEVVFLFLANIRKFKRVDTALRAMHELKKKGIKYKFIVAGKDMLFQEKEKSVEQMSNELGIKDNIIITGWVSPEEVRNIMHISDICINSSIHEGQCIVVYEAAAAGLPLCVSNIGSFTSVFTDSALFHDPNDYKKLAKNILFYIL